MSRKSNESRVPSLPETIHAPAADEDVSPPGAEPMVTIANMDRNPRIIAIRPASDASRKEMTDEDGIALGTPREVAFPMATKHPTEGLKPGILTLPLRMWQACQTNLSARVLIRKGRLREVPTPAAQEG